MNKRGTLTFTLRKKEEEERGSKSQRNERINFMIKMILCKIFCLIFGMYLGLEINKSKRKGLKGKVFYAFIRL